jgi:tryptophanase
MEPCGGSVLFIDASRMFPQIPKSEMPGQTLVVELYRLGGIRSGNMNAKHWVYEEPAGSGVKHNERVDVVRLALPRRVYTKSHLDWVIATFAEVMERASTRRGFTIPEAPDLMKMAGARFVPVQAQSGHGRSKHEKSKL